MVEPPLPDPGDDLVDPEAEACADDDTTPVWTEDVEQRESLVDARWHGERIDKALVAMAPEFSRNHLQWLIEQGHVRVDGKAVVMPSRKVQAGQRLVVALVPTAESRAFRPEAMALAIAFEDEHLLVLNKPAGLVVHPAAGHWSGTLLNGLLAHHRLAATLPRAGIVHRLDKDTSGLMVVGKSLQAVTALVRAIAAREVHREYRAIAGGRVTPRQFSIDAPVGRDTVSRVRMAVTGAGKPARTDVECLVLGEAHTGLRCTLHSGRTHQIRVHLAARGHPLVADVLYGGKPALGMTRQALHAVRLGLQHPVGGQPLTFDAAPPADFETAWQSLQSHG